MTKKVEFLWWASRKIWNVSGKDMEEIIEKCWKMANKYKANHFQVLD